MTIDKKEDRGDIRCKINFTLFNCVHIWALGPLKASARGRRVVDHHPTANNNNNCQLTPSLPRDRQLRWFCWIVSAAEDTWERSSDLMAFYAKQHRERLHFVSKMLKPKECCTI